MRQIYRIGAAMALAASALPLEAQPATGVRSLDHVLVWTRDVDKVSAILTVKLGFQLRPGGDFGDGVANRIIRFPNRSYLELLYFTRPASALENPARKDYSRTERGTLANNFGIEVADVDATARQLRGAGWKLDAETPMTFDPDGDGPLPAQESMWRSVGFPEPPLSASDLFFIRYKMSDMTPVQKADAEVFTRHPNGAVRLSSIWLLNADPEADAARLARLGFERREAVQLSDLGLQGVRFSAADTSILVLKPTGPGAAADALAARGPHLYGLSVEVADIDRAQRVVERGYGTKVTRYKGAAGDAFVAPTHGDLGTLIEFHAGPATAENGEHK